VGKLYTLGRVHKVEIKQISTMRQMLADAQLWVKSQALERES